MRIQSTEFEKIVEEAVASLPRPIQTKLETDGVAIAVQDRPNKSQIMGMEERGEALLGLYEGVPLPMRPYSRDVMPDRITLFKEPIEELASNRAEMIKLICETVVHEVGHYLGLDDEQLGQMGL